MKKTIRKEAASGERLILGKPYREYIAEQFPATVGHISLNELFDEFDYLRAKTIPLLPPQRMNSDGESLLY